MDQNNAYLHRAGATFRGILNDLKRNEAAAARELGVEPDEIEAILAGRRGISQELLERAVRTWPVNERDFFPLHDDAPDGVRVMRAGESEATARVFQRAGADYYEYRDTAMSRVAMIRPEWIKMLLTVDDDEPDNPAVQWNNGHFLYQFTYFVGEVNYYYEWRGEKRCEPMNTGDSVFGLPFAPHSFASRDPAAPGLILALTYGGRLSGDAQHELGILGGERSGRFVLPSDDPAAAHGALLRLHAEAASLSHEELSRRTRFAPARLDALLGGASVPEPEELTILARALGVPERELLPNLPDTSNGVVIVKRRDARSWSYPGAEAPSYAVRELAGSRVTPHSKSLELEVLGVRDPAALEVGLHQYGYALGPTPCVLTWAGPEGERSTILEPGDSFFVKPFVRHHFGHAPGASGDNPRLLLLRVGGKVVGDATLEASAIGRRGLERVVAETVRWYNPAGRC